MASTNEERARHHPDRRRGRRRFGRRGVQGAARRLRRQRRAARQGRRPRWPEARLSAARRGARHARPDLHARRAAPGPPQPVLRRHHGRRERRRSSGRSTRRCSASASRPTTETALVDAMIDRQMDGLILIGPRMPRRRARRRSPRASRRSSIGLPPAAGRQTSTPSTTTIELGGDAGRAASRSRPATATSPTCRSSCRRRPRGDGHRRSASSGYRAAMQELGPRPPHPGRAGAADLARDRRSRRGTCCSRATGPRRSSAGPTSSRSRC